jgi:hypothetical protein
MSRLLKPVQSRGSTHISIPAEHANKVKCNMYVFELCDNGTMVYRPVKIEVVGNGRR